jgi:polysaccharide biosynthesis protein PslH
MRILWVKIGGLWPPDRGGRLRSYHTISELGRRHQVIVATTHVPGDTPDSVDTLPNSARVLSFPHRLPKQGSPAFALALARSWVSTLPVDLSKARVPALERAVRGLLASGAVDVCVADFLAAWPNVPARSPAPTVLFEHNVEHAIWQRLARTETRWLRRALLEIEWRKMRRVEARACRAAALTIAVSEADRAQLAAIARVPAASAARAPGARIESIATGVDTEYFAPSAALERPSSLVFTGSMDWYPNEDAVLHMIDAILPAIRAEVPDVSLTVVGRNPSARLVEAAARAGVRVTGTVSDVRPFVAEGAVSIVPLRVGGGTRLKIFEALAMGKAVVSTSIGAEGLPLTAGEHYLAADEPAEFARAVVGLLRDGDRRRRLGEAGRQLVEARYSWAETARAFEAYLEEAIAGRRMPLPRDRAAGVTAARGTPVLTAATGSFDVGMAPRASVTSSGDDAGVTGTIRNLREARPGSPTPRDERT